MENGIYNSGFEMEDWHLLKNAVLQASNANSKGQHNVFDSLPKNLRASEVGELIYQAVYLGHKKAVKRAANILTGGASNPWLILMKS